MTQHDKPNRWPPKFSVRTLVIVVTLVGAYLGCWEATKYNGLRDVNIRATWGEGGILVFPDDADHPAIVPVSLGMNAASSVPFIVGIDPPQGAVSIESIIKTSQRHYYFWFFGYIAKLPWERESSAGS
jgi:hypothetical protein